MTNRNRNHDDDRLLDAAQALADRDLTELAKPSKAEEAELLAALPRVDADAPVMVSRSIRLPAELETQIKAAADAEGITTSEWMRRALQRVLAGGDTNLVSLTDAITALRNLPHAT